MEIIGDAQCDHEYQLIVALDPEDIFQIEQAAYALTHSREEWWKDKGSPVKDGDYPHITFTNMLKAHELLGAWRTAAEGARSWLERAQDAYYAEEYPTGPTEEED